MGGTIFSRKGNFGRNKARLVQQARKAMFYVLRKARKLSLPIDILLQLFDAMVAHKNKLTYLLVLMKLHLRPYSHIDRLRSV
jgi:hypothetical protein